MAVVEPVPSTVHPFEAAGLGKAPFRYIGMETKVYQACHGAPIQPGGTCDYCSNGIKYCCHIQSADGKRFIVGCDCVQKLNRADNRLVSQVEKAKREIDKANRAAATAKRVAKERVRIEAAFAKLESLRPELATKPHPNEYFASQGKTLADYCDWTVKHAGHKGQFDLAKWIEKKVAD